MAEMDAEEAILCMKIGELGRKSGFSISTLYDYLRTGLLPSPEKKSPTKAYFTVSHLSRLEEIRRLKDQGKSLNDIKIYFSDSAAMDDDPRESSDDVRLAIIDKALELFSNHHYENTKISDITQALNMGNGTFYRYFKSKEELFLYCLERLPRVLVPRDAWTEVDRETDYIKRLKKRGYAMLNAFPSYIGILNYAKLSLGGKDATLARKAAECINSLVRPLTKDLQNAIAAGHVRDVDAEMCAYLLLGINETFGYLLLINPEYSVEKGFAVIEDFIAHALTRRNEPDTKTAFHAEIVDCSMNTIVLDDLTIDGNQCLHCLYLEGMLEVSFDRISRIDLCHDNTILSGDLVMKNNDTVRITLSPDTCFSGRTDLGRFSIPCGKIRQLRFSDTDLQ